MHPGLVVSSIFRCVQNVFVLPATAFIELVSFADGKLYFTHDQQRAVSNHPEAVCSCQLDQRRYHSNLFARRVYFTAKVGKAL